MPDGVVVKSPTWSTPVRDSLPHRPHRRACDTWFLMQVCGLCLAAIVAACGASRPSTVVPGESTCAGAGENIADVFVDQGGEPSRRVKVRDAVAYVCDHRWWPPAFIKCLSAARDYAAADACARQMPLATEMDFRAAYAAGDKPTTYDPDDPTPEL